MLFDASHLFSNAARRMRRSEIRELLKLTRKPDIISFAGGLPAPDLFPIEEFKEISVQVLAEKGATALQYGPTEGDPGLIEQLVAFEKRGGVEITPEQVLVTTASQQGLDLVAKVFINEGDPIVLELPSYIGGLQAFNCYGAEMHGVKHDDYGMRIDSLKATLEKLANQDKTPQFIYVVPDFQNPSGVTMPKERRLQVLGLAKKFNTLVIEDTPYRELRFEGEHEPPFISLDDDERVVTLHTFSKILIPGFRTGWLITRNKQVMDKLVMAKQPADLCTNTFGQMILAEYMKRGLLEKQIEVIKDAYKKKRQIILDAFDENMPKVDGLSWTKPDGGLFLWVRLPEYM
ncbi:aminotransferase class I/II-fold pyridoxal phosphate-dependent enzyme, partial [candidate division WOR-3 bacterium]|nr:aminotransferase class I/II-fold pyridoxal phosphate-dependent enzyme [candidate division WOR-3 bacterium]MBD3365487.1 aminotransferase class I/II-fold pyridoxal phosphate-dependent enzyme [candidate division WOR-3 bacterium]